MKELFIKINSINAKINDLEQAFKNTQFAFSGLDPEAMRIDLNRSKQSKWILLNELHRLCEQEMKKLENTNN